MEQQTNFKVGDRVYCIRFGWGTVKEIDFSKTYSVTVQFDGASLDNTFTNDGHFSTDENCEMRISFTEYTVKVDGFSLERPIPMPKQGQLVYVKDWIDSHWEVRFYSHFDESSQLHCCFKNQKQFGDTVPWGIVEVENPLLNN